MPLGNNLQKFVVIGQRTAYFTRDTGTSAICSTCVATDPTNILGCYPQPPRSHDYVVDIFVARDWGDRRRRLTSFASHSEQDACGLTGRHGSLESFFSGTLLFLLDPMMTPKSSPKILSSTAWRFPAPWEPTVSGTRGSNDPPHAAEDRG